MAGVSTRGLPSETLKRGAVPRHIVVSTSASAVKRLVEPKLRKLQPIYGLQQTAPLIHTGAQEAHELASQLIVFSNDTLLPSQLSSSLRSSHQKQESSERDDFYANMGSAIRLIREETPFLFYKDLNYSIYRDDITFRDPKNTFIGIDKYKLIFWALRFHGQMLFKAIWVEVLRVWQPSDRVIIVRWAVQGIPRVPWEAQGLFEGTSEYKLDEKGMIYQHKVDNIAPSNPSYFNTPALLNLLPSAPSTIPTLSYFKRIALLPLWMKLIAAKCSTWERFYFALTSTINMQGSAHWLTWYLASRWFAHTFLYDIQCAKPSVISTCEENVTAS